MTFGNDSIVMCTHALIWLALSYLLPGAGLSYLEENLEAEVLVAMAIGKEAPPGKSKD